MARRSTRASARNVQGSATPVDSEPDTTQTATQNATGKQRAGAFAFFEGVPLDVLGEVRTNFLAIRCPPGKCLVHLISFCRSLAAWNQQVFFS